MSWTGMETTTTTLLWALLLLATHPHVQEAARAEIREAIGAERLPALCDRVLLPFTEATICEVQRFGSIAPLALLHTATRDTNVLGIDVFDSGIVLSNLPIEKKKFEKKSYSLN